MAQSLLSNERIYLRAPEPADLDKLYIWENDTSLWNAGNAVAPYSRKQLWDYIESYDADIFTSRQLRFIIAENGTNTPVGTIDLYDFDPVNRHVSIGILIAEQHRGKGLGAHALNVLCEYCRIHLGIHSLMAITGKDNAAGLKVFKSCGFSTSGSLKSWIRRGKSYQDAVIMQRLFE